MSAPQTVTSEHSENIALSRRKPTRPKLIYSLAEVISAWRRYWHTEFEANQPAAVNRERAWLREKSNCPQPTKGVDWHEGAFDNTVVLACRIERFFREKFHLYPHRASLMASCPTDEFMTELAAWYALHPVPRPRKILGDDSGKSMQLIDAIRAWNAMYPNDPISDDAARKAAREERLRVWVHEGKQMTSLAALRRWRTLPETRGGKREGAGRPKKAA